MKNTVETAQTPSDDEFSIVATFSEQSLSRLKSIQDYLKEYLGDSIWLTPQRALHSTLTEIICDREYPTPRNKLFINWYERYGQLVAETLFDIPSFYLTFSEIEVSTRAIIIRTATSEAFNDIRTKLLSKIELPEGTKMPPAIIHCTLARFSRSISLEDVVKLTQNIPCDITEHIASFKLLKDLGPLAFEPKTIQIYNLHC
jgi:hypothetical protein